MSDSDTILQALIADVQANHKYRKITPDLVRWLCQKTLDKGIRGKTAVKEVRNKLHQVGGAYFKRKVNYQDTAQNLSNLPTVLASDETRQFCKQLMQAHASTAERLPILPDFFHTCLASIAPVKSVLDLACGLNPLALPWMPLADGFNYQCCDIYLDMVAFLQSFFVHFQIDGEAYPCDLVSKTPDSKAQVAFLLKSMPCLEQLEKGVSLRLLETVSAEHVLVSFPVRSLGGQKKGMIDFYRNHFLESISGKNWKVLEFSFSTELAFLVSK